MRWMVTALSTLTVLFSPSLALAGLPKNNVPGEFWSDQMIAADRFLLPPHVWGFIFAGLAVVVVVAMAVWAFRHPPRPAPVNPPDMDPVVHRRWLYVVIVGFVAFYALAFAGSFSVYDDPNNIWLDKVVNKLTWENTSTILFENHKSVNQEWMFLSLQLSYAAFGKFYAGFLALNLLVMFPLLLLLVHRLAFLLLRSRKIALLSVAFFGFSPTVVELIVWMLERGHFFGLLFGLSSCVAYLHYLDSRSAGGWRPWGLLALSALAYAASQAGKPLFLYVPLWLVLFDVWHLRRDWVRAAVEKLPFLAVGWFFLNRIVSARVSSEPELIGGGLSNTLALDTNLVLEYFHASFVPFQTGLKTPWNEPASWWYVKGIPDIAVHGFAPVASLAILLCLLTAAILLALRWRWPILLLAGVGGVFSVGPVMNLPPHTVVAAYRYTHSMNVLVSIVLAAAVVHAVAPNGPLRGRKWVGVLFATVWLALGAYHSNENRAHWRQPVDLWTRNAYELYPHDGWAHYYAGKTLHHKKRDYEALGCLHVSEKHLPQNIMVHRRLGDSYYAVGDFEHAREEWAIFFRKKPKDIKGKYPKKLIEVGLEELVPVAKRPKPTPFDKLKPPPEGTSVEGSEPEGTGDPSRGTDGDGDEGDE